MEAPISAFRIASKYKREPALDTPVFQGRITGNPQDDGLEFTIERPVTEAPSGSGFVIDAGNGREYTITGEAGKAKDANAKEGTGTATTKSPQVLCIGGDKGEITCSSDPNSSSVHYAVKKP